MKAYVGITDGDWFDLLAQASRLDEVNFWQPGGNRIFRALEPGGLFLFKLHSPRNFIAGGGFFTHATLLPVSLAWESFGVTNGARSLEEMRARIEHYRRRPADVHEDYTIGCVILSQPFFLPEPQWIPAPPDWHPNIVQGRTYDLREQPGRGLWSAVQAAVAGAGQHWPAAWGDAGGPRYGDPVLAAPRLGQGAFRVLVTDAYGRRCAVTGERVRFSRLLTSSPTRLAASIASTTDCCCEATYIRSSIGATSRRHPTSVSR